MLETLERIWWPVLAYSLAMKYVIYEMFGRKTGRFKGLLGKELPKQEGKMAVVTGGSRGIGLEIVRNLLDAGYAIVIGSSATSESRKNLEQSLKKRFPHSKGNVFTRSWNLGKQSTAFDMPLYPDHNQLKKFYENVEVWSLDLAAQKSVISFVDRYLSTGYPLHLLVNNAGIMFVNEEITEDGFEKQFAVNYLSHCLLTLLLLPVLSKSGTVKSKSRIINCTSCIHYVGTMDLNSILKRKYYSKYRAYIESKLAQVMFTYSLQSHLTKENLNVTVNCVHPGVVNTELMSKVLLFPSFGSLLFKTAKEGAETATYAALSPEMEGIGGMYLEECEPVPSSKISQDVQLQKQLWEKTLSLLSHTKDISLISS